MLSVVSDTGGKLVRVRMLLGGSEAEYQKTLREKVKVERGGRNDSVCIRHPAAHAVFGAKSNQKWFAFKLHGGEAVAYKLAHEQAESWEMELQKVAASRESLFVCLCCGRSCPCEGKDFSRKGVEGTISHWEGFRVVRAGSIEHKLLFEAEGVKNNEWRRREKVVWGTSVRDPG